MNEGSVSTRRIIPGPGKFERDPRNIPPPQIIPGSEHDLHHNISIANETEPQLYVGEPGQVAGVANWLDATKGRIVDGYADVDSRIHPDEQASGPLPGQEGIPKLPAEIVEAEAALRRLEVAVRTFDESEVVAVRTHIMDKDPDVILFKAISELVALRNTPSTADWQPRLEKLAKSRVNELATAADLARRRLVEYPKLAAAVIQLSYFTERYAITSFPEHAKIQRVQAEETRKDKARRLKKHGLAGLSS